ncbi:M24 family metallopeptidase [archaeon AH-315-M20]|nr:M24 family metallopeptidase [archaeon AH-315-M20]
MKIKAILEKKRANYALFYNLDSLSTNPNMFYFSQYSGLGALIIPKKQAPFLIVPEMEIQRAKQSNIKKVYSMDKKKFFASIHNIIKKRKLNSKNTAIANNNFTLNVYKQFKKQFKKTRTKDISLDCLKLRETKTQKEIQILKKSCNYANKILKKTIKQFKNLKTEAEVAAFLEYETKKLGLDISFPPIVASGSNAGIPHHEPTNKKLKKGFCVIDFGVKYKGYCSDITRTIYIGKPNKKEKQIYNFLLNIQKNIIKNIEIENKCSKIYENCVKDLKNYSKYFTHGLGHGVGVEIHELPNLTLNSKDKIKENITFTIEPGIYIPKKFGIRIEDTILMKKKTIVLTKATKDLLTF